jgi:hypothetical protein
VSRTYVMALTHVRAGPLRPSKRQGELEAPDNQILKPGPESMSRCIEFACDAKRIETATNNMLASTCSSEQLPQAELKVL